MTPDQKAKKASALPCARARRAVLRPVFVLAMMVSLVQQVSAQAERGVTSDSGPEKDTEIRRSLERITAVMDVATSHSAEPVDVKRLIYDGAIAGALSRLDPFTVFLDEQQFLALRQQQRGVRQGFGAVLNVQAGKITVLQAVPDSPFARAGLGPGDRIVSVNGERIMQLDLEEIINLLQQARHGKVRLSVLQSGGVVAHDFDLDPAEVSSPTVDKKFLLAPGVGYLHVARIEASTPQEIQEALQGWSAGPLRGLVLDLRDNPGGVVDGAVATAGLFLAERASVVSLRGRNAPELKYATQSAPAFPALPLVVMVNGRSASSAEIISAALQEHDRAWLVGENSFGKAVAESVLPLSQGAALVLTTARYLTPRGRSLQKALPETALAGILTEGQGGFTTANHRPLRNDGGLWPDEMVPPWRLGPLMEALQQSTAFINFAQAYLQRHGKVGNDFSATADVVREFEEFLSAAGFRAPEEEWNKALPWIRVRIEAEILTLVFGIVRGDEVETRADPQVQAAVAALKQAEALVGSK